jgi:transposase
MRVLLEADERGLSGVRGNACHYFRKWRIEGTWERMNRAVRERLRVRLGRNPQLSAANVPKPANTFYASASGKAHGYVGQGFLREGASRTVK